MTDTLQLTNTTDTLEVTADFILAKDLQLTHTGIGTARIDVPENDDIIPYVQRQDRVHYLVDGECEFTGYAVGFAGSERDGRWTLRVDGVGKRLEETRPNYDGLAGGVLTYESIPLDSALRDYLNRTEFTNASVFDEQPEQVASDATVLEVSSGSDWESITSFADDEPLVVSGGNLELAQTTQFTEAENADAFVGTEVDSTAVSGALSNDAGIQLSVENDFVELEFTPDYRIPADEYFADAYVSYENFTGTVETTVNGQTVASLSQSDATSENALLGSPFVGMELAAGESHTMRVALTDYTSGTFVVDTLQLLDAGGRFGGWGVDRVGTLDSTTLAFDAPQLYPDAFEAELDSVALAYNITELTYDGVFNNTENQQRICLSNDNGSTYECASNTRETTQGFPDSFGRNARIKLRLGRFTADTTSTPSSGDSGQFAAEFVLSADGNDRTIVDELELSRSHFENLKKLCGYGEYQWTIEHDNVDISQLVLNCSPRGQVTRPTPTAFEQVQNRSPEVAAETYFNSIYLEGRLRADGTRPTADLQDDEAVARDDREITPGVLRDPSIGTEAGAVYRARSLLERALEARELRGSITTYPADAGDVWPGYAYSVDWGNGPTEKTLERVSIRESAGSIQAVYEFVVRPQLSETLDSLRQNARDVSNQV